MRVDTLRAAAHQASDHPTITHVGRRHLHRMNYARQIIHAYLQLRPTIPLFALLRNTNLTVTGSNWCSSLNFEYEYTSRPR